MLLRCITIQRVSFSTPVFSVRLLLLIWLLVPGLAHSGRCGTLQQPGRNAGFPTTNTIVEMPADTFLLDFDKDIVDQIPPFDVLYELAVKNSPTLRYEQANGEAEKANYSLAKIALLKNAYPYVNYSNGGQNLASYGSIVGDLSQAINGYRYGVNVQIPLDELIGRKTKMRQAAASYRAALARRQVEELNIKRELIRTYQDMLTSQRILKVRYRDEQTSGMALQLAEVELKQGKIEPRELAQISNFYAQAKSATEYQSGEFLKHFYDLQAMIGVSMQEVHVLIRPPSVPLPAPAGKPKR